MSSLLKGAIKLFHGAVKDFDSFDSKFATETAFGKGFSFTPDEKIAKDYAEITPSKIKKLWGKEHVEAALERKKDGIPILYEVEASIRTNELLLARKNFKDQNKQVKTKLNKLIKEEKIDKSSLDLDKPKFWKQLVKESGKDADTLFTKYGIKAILKDATESKLKQVGGTLEYTVFDPKVLDIKNKVFLQEKRMGKKSMLARGGEANEKELELEERFDAAFIEARKDGKETFMFEGEEYTTDTAEEELAERRAKEGSGPLWRRNRDDSTIEQRQEKDYDAYIVKESLEGRGESLSRAAQMRADALIKERGKEMSKKSEGSLMVSPEQEYELSDSELSDVAAALTPEREEYASAGEVVAGAKNYTGDVLRGAIDDAGGFKRGDHRHNIITGIRLGIKQSTGQLGAEIGRKVATDSAKWGWKQGKTIAGRLGSIFKRRKGGDKTDDKKKTKAVGGKIISYADKIASRTGNKVKEAFMNREFLRDMVDDPKFQDEINNLPEADYKTLMDEVGFDYDMGTGSIGANTSRAFTLDPEDAAKNYMDFGDFENISEYLSTRSPSELRVFIDTLEETATTDADFRVLMAAERILDDMIKLKSVETPARTKKNSAGIVMEDRIPELKRALSQEDGEAAYKGKLTREQIEVLGAFPSNKQVRQFQHDKAVQESNRQRQSVNRLNQEQRMGQAAGGMPVDTYPNIPPEEMAAAKESQLPDEQMEDDYIGFVMDQSLDEEDQMYLAEKLEEDPRLSDILDRIVLTAGEFSGTGEVSGPGTGVSDSIPARLSDGEFVVTKKATDQIGADNLQRMMDDAERAYDGGYQKKAIGGYAIDNPDESEIASPNIIDEEIKKAMIGSNKIPSLQ